MKKFNCIHCLKENLWVRSHNNKYCSNACQGEHRFLTETLLKFKKGGTANRRTQIKCLTHLYGYKCVLCGNSGEHNLMPLVLQLDHIDGNAGNHQHSNLRLLCPNCHSQTDTFVAKNKGKGRQSRGLKR